MSAPCVCSHALDDHKCVTWDPVGEMADKKGTCWRCPCDAYVPARKSESIEIVEAEP
jgi:hypothetical protein